MQSYLEILEMDPLPFLTFLEQFKTDINYSVEDAESMQAAGNHLGVLANNYGFLASLYSYAGVKKRQFSRDGKALDYQDMVDREAALERTMKAVDMQYRALSKAITVHIENNKELYMIDGYSVRQMQSKGRK